MWNVLTKNKLKEVAMRLFGEKGYEVRLSLKLRRKLA